MRGTPSDLERRLARPYAALMIAANVIGAVIVAALIRWVLPLPAVDDPDHVQQGNLLALVAYLAFAVPTRSVPVLGLALVGAGELSGVLKASSHRLAVTAVALGGVALVVGLSVMALTARSLADPLEGVRRGLRKVQRGEDGAAVDVYDGSEVG